MSPQGQICAGPVPRRDFLKLGAGLLGGSGLANLLNRRALAKESGKSGPDTSVIFLWLPGGPPHMEMYDLKPDAPAEYRGIYKPINTSIPGMDIGELLPLHARIADKFSLVRSIAHQFAGHGDGMKHLLTGRTPGTPEDFVTIHPMVGSMVAKCREDIHRGIPNYISVTDPGREGIDVYGFGSAYLGPSTLPFIFAGDPSDPKFEVPNLSVASRASERLTNRIDLLHGLDRWPATRSASEKTASIDVNREKALELLQSNNARKAFDLGSESPKLREKYGMHAWGQRCLLARRLVEHGASFVTMVLENPYQSGHTMLKEGTYNWDSHAVNCHMFRDLEFRLPIYDRCVTALIEDLYDRGLDQKVLLVVTGEFGRTPRISTSVGTQTGVVQPGRDHWPNAMSLLLSGGGLRMGQVVGSTNSKGENPKDRPLAPTDLWATVFHHLGIDWLNTSFPDYRGRPLPILPSGEPIRELI